MARDTTAKGRAGRLDPNGYRKPSALVRARPAAAWVVSLLAVAWVAIAGRPGGSDQAIYSPGPVAAAHANFANDCAACHDGGDPGKNNFSRSISDAACLKCHEAPIHHAHQVDLRSGASSAGCASCHVEHRGIAALSAANDATCTACHADLAGRSSDPKSGVARHVTSFAVGAHPTFGRKLKAGAGDTWVDPTRLRFNHKLHFGQEGKPQLKDCSTCHVSADRSTDASALDASLVRSYMRPVSYDLHCKSCHAITLPGAGAVSLAHDRLDVVRTQLNAMPALVDAVVNGPAAPPAAGADEAVARVQEALDQVVEAIKPVARDNKASFDPITQFLRSRAAGDPAAVKATTTEATLRGAKVNQPHAKRVEWAVVFASEGRCTKCHDVSGEVVPGFTEPSRPPVAGDSLVPAWETLPAAPGAELTTFPTGISATSSRQWFAASRFDHRSHRSVTCIDCHADVQQSSKTSDLSLPDLATKPAGRPTAKSCVECHHAGGGGVASSCVTCHSFHNSRLEAAPVGKRGDWELLLSTVAPESVSTEPPPAVADPSTSATPAERPAATAESPTSPPANDLPPPPDAAPTPADAPPTTDLPPAPEADLPPPPDLPPAPDADLPPPPDVPSPDLPPPP